MGNKNIKLSNTKSQYNLANKQKIFSINGEHSMKQRASSLEQPIIIQNKICLSQETRNQLKNILLQQDQMDCQERRTQLIKFQSEQLQMRFNQQFDQQGSTKSNISQANKYISVVNRQKTNFETASMQFLRMNLSLSQKLSIRQQEDIGQDIIQNLLLKEVDSISPNALENQPKLSSTDRARFIDWSIKVLSGIEAQDQVLFRAVTLSDRAVRVWKSHLEFKGYQLLALTCIEMAAKLQEHNLMNVDDARVYLGKKRFTKKEIVQTEIQVLELLKFKTMTPTVYDFTLPLISFVFEFLSRMSSQLSKEHKKHAQKLAIFLSMLVLHEPDIMFYKKPSQIGAAIVYLALNFLKKMKSTYLNERKIEKILNYIGFLTHCSGQTIIFLSLQIKKLYYQFEEKYPVAQSLVHNLCPEFAPSNMFSQ